VRGLRVPRISSRIEKKSPQRPNHRMSQGLATLEELLLLATSALGDEAYGVSLHDKLVSAGVRTSLGSIYSSLERMEQRALVQSVLGEATAARGGRRKRLFRLTARGRAALSRQNAVRVRLLQLQGEPSS
jgi:PadR family transcriptional regulator, regulatory protein PadR